MSDSDAQLKAAADIAGALSGLGVNPVLVGGMALVVLGSRRVTQDFDFVISQPADRMSQILSAFYGRGFELVSKLDAEGNVASTVDNRRLAAARLRLDEPASVYFFNHDLELRIDLLFDFPLPATDLAARATRITISGQRFAIASEADLMQLKRIAKAARSFAGDAQDIEFLESRLKRV